jgi:hypothetical protein
VDSIGLFSENFKVIGSNTPIIYAKVPRLNQTFKHRHAMRFWVKKSLTNKKLKIELKKGYLYVYNYYSNKGPFIDSFIDGSYKGIGKMSGTSQATAIATGNEFSK